MEGMDRITASAQEISGVVEAIDSIADRTNLLALNASIEAARAGAEGRGFAVVAHEISRLADQSAESTRSIGQLIQHATESASEGVALARQVDEAVARMKATADHSALLAGQMTARIEEQLQFRERIERAARNLNLMSAQIHGATREHSNLTMEIHRGVENLFGSAQKSSSVSEQVLGETAQLSAEAARLHDLLKRFKLPA
jgi:methyl-accepting chemotaxis protein